MGLTISNDHLSERYDHLTLGVATHAIIGCSTTATQLREVAFGYLIYVRSFFERDDKEDNTSYIVTLKNYTTKNTVRTWMRNDLQKLICKMLRVTRTK